MYPEAHLIYIMPPSYEELIKRLKGRQTENSEDFKKRVERIKMELSLKDQFDYLIEINITHNFFAKFSNNAEFVQIITEFALAIVAAELHFEESFNVERYRTFINKFISTNGGGIING